MRNLPDVQISLPFGMKGIKVIGIKENNGSLTILVQKALEFGLCPVCGTISQKVNDRRAHGVTDRPIFENGTKIEVLKRRWKCINDFCEVNTFTEEIEGLPKRWTHTELFYQEVYQLSRRMTYTGVYEHLQDANCRVSLSGVYKKAQRQLREGVILPKMVKASFVGLDEFSKGKGHDYGVVLTNLKRKKIIDVTDGGKTKKAPSRLLDELDPSEVNACCIDMWRPFRDACREKLPHVVIVVDPFHVIKEVNEALDKVRTRARNHQKSKLKKEALSKYKKLILMGLEKLTPRQEERLWEILSWHKDLSLAYELKELLRAIYVGRDLQKASQELDSWIKEAYQSGIEEMKEVAKTLSNWREEILNFWVYPITNAVTEGKINKIKALRRRVYNYNNFQSLRLKILEQE
jgi:transposase